MVAKRCRFGRSEVHEERQHEQNTWFALLKGFFQLVLSLENTHCLAADLVCARVWDESDLTPAVGVIGFAQIHFEWYNSSTSMTPLSCNQITSWLRNASSMRLP